ncbi:MAG: disulfide bond formation protein B [Gammaproteobacteria bacterium]|nr:disulfide bond formation protein B [Gammaproteobacteria bacterium]
MQRPATRTVFLLAFVAALGLIGAALYLEHVVGLEPCPLCHVQRFAVVLFAALCLLATLQNPQVLGQRIYAVFMLLAASLGIATASRQIWLQGLPEDQLPSCLPPLEFMLEAFPLQEIITKMLHGTADCAAVDWTLLGLNIAQLNVMSFSAMLLLSLYVLLRKQPGTTTAG